MNRVRSSVHVEPRAAVGAGSLGPAPALPRPASSTASIETIPSAVDLERHVPAFLAWIANKLARGASQHYLKMFNVGIETWRCLALFAAEGSISAQRVAKVIGMDKGTVSRCFKSMQARGLITVSLDDHDGRLRIATLTRKGRTLHDEILAVALARERALLSVLSEAERETLIALLQRLHENLPEVEAATTRYIDQRHPGRQGRRGAGPADTPPPSADS